MLVVADCSDLGVVKERRNRSLFEASFKDIALFEVGLFVDTVYTVWCITDTIRDSPFTVYLESVLAKPTFEVQISKTFKNRK